MKCYSKNTTKMQYVKISLGKPNDKSLLYGFNIFKQTLCELMNESAESVSFLQKLSYSNKLRSRSENAKPTRSSYLCNNSFVLQMLCKHLKSID